MILLDTHVLVWVGEDPTSLGPKTSSVLDEHQDDQWCSAISFWEVAMLFDKGRMSLSLPLDQWVRSIIVQGQVKVAAVSAGIACSAGVLPGDLHGDPGDRIIIATARALGCPLVTADRKILAYAAAGHVRAIDARR